MPYSKDYLQYVLEQLAGLRGALSRRMFGGAGLYHEELFFGLIFRDTLYFRVNDANRPDYEALGMSRFRPYADKPHLSFNYYEVPAHVLEDSDELVSWARRSLQAAQAAAAEAVAGGRAKATRPRVTPARGPTTYPAQRKARDEADQLAPAGPKPKRAAKLSDSTRAKRPARRGKVSRRP